MILWAMPHRATQDGWVMVESSDKMWSTGDSQTQTGKSGSLLWGPCSFLLGPGAQGSVCALQESISQSYVSSGISMVGLTVTSSKRAYAIPRSAVPVAEKQISIRKTKIDVFVTNWTGIAPTYPIHNSTLLCVSPEWTIVLKLSLCFTYFSIVLVFLRVVLLLLWSV